MLLALTHPGHKMALRAVFPLHTLSRFFSAELLPFNMWHDFTL